jgi:hypothetical protein
MMKNIRHSGAQIEHKKRAAGECDYQQFNIIKKHKEHDYNVDSNTTILFTQILGNK